MLCHLVPHALTITAMSRGVVTGGTNGSEPPLEKKIEKQYVDSSILHVNVSAAIMQISQSQRNVYGMRIERHLPKTGESVVRPAGERR